MSPPDRQLVLSPQAEDDLADILQYTLETWGESQMQVYGKVLDDGLRMILDNPLIGFTRLPPPVAGSNSPGVGRTV